ncbi:hypothetical protein BD410DRAFT_800464 [Rickenella mellea]|uniref:Uncharacterized protein n=1 Tax=Rickenella mellea TaxID=50990 RepID=A0A4Y7QID8_9AGAM|nr:hypothetical protein BD410DRAFT_800464 [Rickenella mellea]
MPFLRRNVIKSFRAMCVECGIPTAASQESQKYPPIFSVTYSHHDGQRHDAKVDSWHCPLCHIFNGFSTQKMLEAHLEWDHEECDFVWNKKLFRGIEIPHLIINVPQDPGSSSEELSSSSESERETTAPPQSPIFLNRSPSPEQKPFLRASSMNVVVKEQSPPSSPLRPSQAPPPSRRPERPVDRTGQNRYPTPPPYENLEGPSAVYPYLPPGEYSARPGGPKLYDLLNTLSMEPFGVMKWFVLDKEEEIFELCDVRDEDKVMQALWARWIILNRNKFISNYFLGVQAFITQYWREIHKAAGFSALRVWLLVLVSNRFLTGPQFFDILKYYTDQTGMDLWK